MTGDLGKQGNMVHQNELDAGLTPEQRRMAEHTIATFGLSGLHVIWVAGSQSLRFSLDRRVVTIPYTLYQNECWTDIRYLFRAILDKAPAVANRASPNGWGPVDDPMGSSTTIEQK